MTSLFLPLSRAFAQLKDPVFFGVVWRSVLFAILFFGLILGSTVWAVHQYVHGHGYLAWVLDALGSIASAVLAMWLFLPVAATIGTFYFERIASAVERQYYPSLPRPHPAPVLSQLWDSIVVGLRVLGFSVLALLLTIFIPGIGLPLGWAVATWAMGRGLFVAVAMRRLDRPAAEALPRGPPSRAGARRGDGGGCVFPGSEFVHSRVGHGGDGACAGHGADSTFGDNAEVVIG